MVYQGLDLIRKIGRNVVGSWSFGVDPRPSQATSKGQAGTAGLYCRILAGYRLEWRRGAIPHPAEEVRILMLHLRHFVWLAVFPCDRPSAGPEIGPG
jgi:hypothetical protein